MGGLLAHSLHPCRVKPDLVQVAEVDERDTLGAVLGTGDHLEGTARAGGGGDDSGGGGEGHGVSRDGREA